MLYEKYFRITERSRWQLESDIDWDAIVQDKALAQSDILDQLHGAALIESFAPMYALKGLQVWWNSIEESAIASIQFYEEYKHFHALQRYLTKVGRPVADRELLHIREVANGQQYPDRVRQLANYMLSEHFTAFFYRRLFEKAEEPVLKRLLQFLMEDEFRHCNIFYLLLEQRIAQDASVKDTVIEEALNFRHQGTEAVGENMPIAVKNDFEALMMYIQKVERLTGINLPEYKRGLQGQVANKEKV